MIGFNSSKGNIYVTELVIGSLLVTIFLLAVIPNFIGGESLEQQKLKVKAEDVLITLDDQGKLKDYIRGDDWKGFENDIRRVVPSGTGFCVIVDGERKAGSCKDEGEVSSAWYMVSTLSDDGYEVHNVRLMLW